jgi:hypothetical protein
LGSTLLLIEKATHDPLYLWDIRHPEVIRWDDGEAGIVEDTPDGDGVADAALLTCFTPQWASTVVVSSTDLP